MVTNALLEEMLYSVLISGSEWQSVAINAPIEEMLVPREVDETAAVRVHLPSDGAQTAIRGHQRSSEVIN